MHKGPANPERSFGLSVGTVLLLIAAALVWRGRLITAEVIGGVGAVLVLLGYFQPRWLKYPSALWWKFALALGYVNARVILSLIFLILLTPMGLLWRLIGRDPLGRRRARWVGWSAYPPRYRERTHYTRMF